MVADAAIAILVVSMGLVAVIQAQSMVRRMGPSAVELRLGAAEAMHHLEADWPRLLRPGSLQGRGGPGGLMEWTIAARPTGAFAGASLAVCAVDSRVRFQGSGRVVTLRTRRLCRRSA